MSIHRSLVSKSNLGRSRNVLTRYERILEMRKLGNWDEEEGNPVHAERPGDPEITDPRLVSHELEGGDIRSGLEGGDQPESDSRGGYRDARRNLFDHLGAPTG